MSVDRRGADVRAECCHGLNSGFGWHLPCWRPQAVDMKQCRFRAGSRDRPSNHALARVDQRGSQGRRPTGLSIPQTRPTCRNSSGVGTVRCRRQPGRAMNMQANATLLRGSSQSICPEAAGRHPTTTGSDSRLKLSQLTIPASVKVHSQ
jgi:hypothetical protein